MGTSAAPHLKSGVPLLACPAVQRTCDDRNPTFKVRRGTTGAWRPRFGQGGTRPIRAKSVSSPTACGCDPSNHYGWGITSHGATNTARTSTANHYTTYGYIANAASSSGRSKGFFLAGGWGTSHSHHFLETPKPHKGNTLRSPKGLVERAIAERRLSAGRTLVGFGPQWGRVGESGDRWL